MEKNTINNMGMIRFRVIVLWIAIMVGFTLHNLADMMPLFWNVDIVVEPSGTAPTGLLFFMMTISYLIPVIGLLCVSYMRKTFGAASNIVLAIFIMLFNLFHSSELFINFNPVQLAILPVMDVLGILLVVDSVKLYKFRKII